MRLVRVFAIGALLCATAGVGLADEDPRLVAARACVPDFFDEVEDAAPEFGMVERPTIRSGSVMTASGWRDVALRIDRPFGP